MLRLLVPGAFLASLLIAAPAHAQSVDEDVRCLILGSLFQRTETEPAKKQIAAAVAQYYLGRVSARVPAGELKRRYLAQATRLPANRTGPMMTACFTAMQAQGRAVDAVRVEIGRSMTKAAAPTKR